MIVINDLRKRFGKITALAGLNIDIDTDGVFAVLGPNGSGKTTLIKCILGMVIPDQGSIRIGDENILGQWAYREKIAYMPQSANFPPNLKVSELIRMIKAFRTEAQHEEELITRFQLDDSLEKKIGNLSGGTRQKVNIVLTFMLDAPLIILDEPTSGLDPVALMHLKELILAERQKGKTVLVTSHSMSFVNDVSEEIVFLLEGRIHFRGSIAQLKERTHQKELEPAIVTLLQGRNV
ncbi:MAG: ABC transporter ATP-binding protein [Fidelibacterota bacterium]